MAKQNKQANKNTKLMALLISYTESKNEYVYNFSKELLEYDSALEKAKKITKS